MMSSLQVELDSRHCDVIVGRWQEWSGERAVLEGDGRTLEVIGKYSKRLSRQPLQSKAERPILGTDGALPRESGQEAECLRIAASTLRARGLYAVSAGV
jgi:hypothetical protein